MNDNRKLTTTETMFYFIFSIILNSFANALTISTNLGSALWTASAANLSKLTGIDLGTVLFFYGILVVIFNAILLGRLEWPRMVGNLIFITPFSYLVQVITQWLSSLHIIEMPIIIRLILDLVAILLIAIAVSIYQRVNLVLHPNDDLAYILRFKYLHGDPSKAQIASFIPPLIILIISGIIMKNLVAVNIGTVIALFFQGSLIGWADRYIFTNLKHNI
ncbi:hypothetical protein RD055328_11480 [Companilactobacillus sp. RD055328]|uniref:hypothetical protein n=1 Tax=Companilactobacillus sp. RD055328 TaxID=2916634 RepID=UPI001FC7BDBB|nr:hypothetical protein [Companilactobacillus sp. RD055328]GKQ43225.1 hypothetical protein RD055328_11480 [Companilactobacillus sp. RD055328]